MTDKLILAATQALEALEKEPADYADWIRTMKAARAALRAALAEQPAEPVAHLKKLLDAMHRESNAKHNLNEWLRASPAFAQRASQAEAEWVVAVKHLVAMQMDAEKYAAGHTAPQPDDTALLQQARDTMAYWLEHGETPGAHDLLQRTHDALRERLGEEA